MGNRNCCANNWNKSFGNVGKSWATVVQTIGTKVLEPLARVGEALWNKSFGTVGAKVLEPLTERSCDDGKIFGTGRKVLGRWDGGRKVWGRWQ